MTEMTSQVGSEQGRLRAPRVLEVPVGPVDPVTPLRYPGGKQKLAEFLRRCVIAANDPDLVYIEPYAGGAGAALSLLYKGEVARVVINDLDPAIHAFWYAAVHHNAELRTLVAQVDVSIDSWLTQREIYRSADMSDPVRLGFATLYLNRTSRSGVLGAGVIGGYGQSGRYKVGARFYRETLLDRLAIVGRLAERIEVSRRDGVELIDERTADAKSFFYVDPPYYDKGASIYLNAFEHEDHLALAECLNRHADAKWILTYDRAPEISVVYARRRTFQYALRYSAHRTQITHELLVASDSVMVPRLPPNQPAFAFDA